MAALVFLGSWPRHCNLCHSFTSLLEKVIKQMWPPVDLWDGPGHTEVLTLSPSLKRGFCLPFLFPEAAPRTEPEMVMQCWEHLDSVCDYTRLRILCKLLRFGGQVQNPLIRKFPLLTKCASFLSSPWPPSRGGWFQSTPEKPGEGFKPVVISPSPLYVSHKNTSHWTQGSPR